jgi:hypothetical protein
VGLVLFSRCFGSQIFCAIWLGKRVTNISSWDVLREFGRNHHHREFAIREIAAEFPLQIENRGVNAGCSQRSLGANDTET